MFTGIIERVGTVLDCDTGSAAVRMRIRTGFQDLALGESVSVNGVCLTVTESEPAQGDALFFVSPETASRTQLGALRTGSKVNLERALLAGGRLSGHVVQGHVDAVGTVVRVEPEAGGSFLVEFDVPESLRRYCVAKGSVAINGVSLTLNRVDAQAGGGCRAGVTLIPHTWEHTQFQSSEPGDPVNIEVDVLAKYVVAELARQRDFQEQLCQPNL